MGKPTDELARRKMEKDQAIAEGRFTSIGREHHTHDNETLGRWDKEHDHTMDMVNHPPHYKAHPSGVECITITEHMSFCLGNAMKYIWRADAKGDAIKDLEKARWYINREIDRRRRNTP